MFLPTTPQEVNRLGWKALDVILVSGDSYLDTPFNGTAVIGKILLQAGYRVAIIAQPDVQSAADITRLGEPLLFWGVSGGSVDSMVANYTALKKKRKSDDYTPGGMNTRRPDRAVISYANLIKRFNKNSAPIVLGGIEASLRRIAHYDYWSDRIRRSILLDAKADYLLYGMAEVSILQLAKRLADHHDPRDIRGLCYAAAHFPEGYLELPSYETVISDKLAFIEMFHTFYRNNDPVNASGLAQLHGDRYLVHNPPAHYPDQKTLDGYYHLEYERAQHPFYEAQGKVKALETIQFAINTHRGCYGECNFCAIAVHEGRTIRWRSAESILEEAAALSQHPDFHGYIHDLGGPTANMYGIECELKFSRGSCKEKRCMFPDLCPLLKIDHAPQIELLQRVRAIPGIKKVFVASGIRYDLVMADQRCGMQYLDEIVNQHISGQMKIAPEHSQENVLRHMGKPGKSVLVKFKKQFDELNRKTGRQQFLTYYLIAAYPGCSESDMIKLKQFASQELRINPEQVQIFTPSPSTYGSVMYYTEMDPFSRKPIFVEKDLKKKQRQKDIVTQRLPVLQCGRRPSKNG